VTRRIAIAVAAAGLAVGVQAEYFAMHAHWTENHVLDVMVGWVFIGAGLVAWVRRPGNRMGPLMVLFGFTWFIGNLAAVGEPVLTSLGKGFEGLNGVILAHLVLAYPTGRLATRGERVLVATGYTLTVLNGVARTITFDPSGAFPHCVDCQHGALALFPRAFPTVDDIGGAVAAVLALGVLALLLMRYARATPPARHALAPLWIAGICTGFVYFLGGIASSAASGSSLDSTTTALQKIVEIGIPLAFLAGLLRTRRERSPIGDLVVALGHPLPRGGLRGALAQALGDPSLELAFARPGGGFVDAAGRSLALPRDDAGRAVTLIEDDGRAVAALIHDAALNERLPVVEAAGAAARLALENERLQAELRAQLEEVRASRARIVGAGDAERRRLERDLHDGAQQRLIALSLALTLARQHVEEGMDPTLAASLEEAAAEAKLALDEIRELARGLHPSILTEAGLGPALESLAERSTLPVVVHGPPRGRLPQPVEATAYFVASEALANAGKHSRASMVTVEARRINGALVIAVDDDGVGGADPGDGSGLRGLEDRLAAAGGRLHVISRAGEGTHLTAEIPCE
jgi:signal transduction histidine kinase